MIVSTPHSLLQYNLMSLSTIQTVIIDEADLIISNGGKHFSKLLKSLRDQAPDDEPKQFVFVAATLPQRGEKSVFNKIRKWFPDVVHITSSMVHQCVPSLASVDVFINEEEKLPQLLKHLNVLNRELSTPLDRIPAENNFNIFAESQRNKHLKILVFANTIAMSRNVFEFLNSQDGRTFEVLDKMSASSKNNESDTHKQCLIRHKLRKDNVESWVHNNEEVFITETGSTLPWQDRVGLLHKEMSMVKRQEVLRKFKSNQITVLVSTDLASRGLDILDVTHVIQLDYAHNAIDVLHRAGRTARAGAKGTIINFITEKDHDLWKATQLSQQRRGTEGFQEIFSRNRMFNRRIKRKLKITQE